MEAYSSTGRPFTFTRASTGKAKRRLALSINQVQSANFWPLALLVSSTTVMSGPPLFQLDFALMKSVYVREKVRTQFRVTMANALNHPNFVVPRSNISSRGTLGTIAGQVRVLNGSPSPREIDLGLRVEF